MVKLKYKDLTKEFKDVCEILEWEDDTIWTQQEIDELAQLVQSYGKSINKIALCIARSYVSIRQ